MPASKLTLSGSTDGRPIKIVQTKSPGTTIHTASSTSTNYDEIWLYAQNTDTASIKLTIEFGNTTSPDDLFEQTIPGESGLYLIASGLIIKGNATPLVVRAFAGTANLITIAGYVNRIS